MAHKDLDHMDHLLLLVELLKYIVLLRANHAKFLLTFWFQFTCSEGIPNIVLDASTSWDVVLDSTDGIDATSPRTRIHAM